MFDRTPPDLFDRLPGHFRTRDAEEGRALEALFALFGEELQLLEQDIDQLYDNWFVETCEPWVLPYLAALVGARPMREIGVEQAGLLRAYVANILQFRQAKGTAAVVEQVARSVSGWSVVAVEFFQRLATSQHVNHVRGDAPAFASVRDSTRARNSRSPFSAMAHAPAAGVPAGWSGRYNIPHLGLFIWRNAAAPVWPIQSQDDGYLGGAEPASLVPGNGLLTFDPLGRDLPLVNRPAADHAVAARVVPRMVPMPLGRAAVHDALNAARDRGETPERWFEEDPPFRVRLDGGEVPPARLFCCNLQQTDAGVWRRPANAGEVLVDPELGRLSLHPMDEGKPVETGFASIQHFDIGGGAYDRRASLGQWLPAFEPDTAGLWQIGVSKLVGSVTDDPLSGGPVVDNFREAVRRWNDQATEGARGIITVLDNATYTEALNTDGRRILLPKGARLAIVAAAWPVEEKDGGRRERQVGQLAPMDRGPVLRGPLMVDAADAGDDEGGTLIVDGLVLAGNVSARPGGDLLELGLYNCTVGAEGPQLERAVLALGGNARMSLVLDRCIVSRVDLREAAGALRVRRSIIGEDRGGAGAAVVLRAPNMDATVDGSTVIGGVSCRSLRASNGIFTRRIEVSHRQIGCVRFSFVEDGEGLPRRYRCVSAGDEAATRPVFVSTRFEDPEFGRLAMGSPPVILEGAEDGMEMGVGHANRDPARRANIRDAVEEFAPVGLVPGLIYMT